MHWKRTTSGNIIALYVILENNRLSLVSLVLQQHAADESRTLTNVASSEMKVLIHVCIQFVHRTDKFASGAIHSTPHLQWNAGVGGDQSPARCTYLKQMSQGCS